MSLKGICIVVRLGVRLALMAKSSNPVIDTLPGTSMLLAWHSNKAPVASTSLLHKIAVGGVLKVRSWRQAARPASML